MDEVLQELRALNARFDAYETNVNGRLDAIDKKLNELMSLVVANHEDILENRNEIRTLRELVDANSDALQRIESNLRLRAEQIESNSHEIERLTEAFNAKFPGYLE